jgi:phosphate transport system permease protein
MPDAQSVSHREARASTTGARAFARRVFSGDEVARAIVTVSAGAILLITVLLVYELWVNSSLSRQHTGWGFLTSQSWDPIADQYGALQYVYGTVVTSVLALLIAVPVGIGASIFLSELAPPRMSSALSFLIELLAAVPSVIYGLIGIYVMMPWLRTHAGPVLQGLFGWTPFFTGPFYGPSFLTAGLLLGIMVLPFIVSVSRQILLAVPNEQREGALALGATKWEMTWQVVVPFARRGIIGSIFLALARALGETMAVTMVIGNNPQIKASLLAPGYSIASAVANEFTEATSDLHRSSLIELGLVLFGLTVIVNGVARLLVRSGSKFSAQQT